MRIHVTGASGAGTTTLGRDLAAQLGCEHFDSDDYFWMPTEPPYRTKRDPAERDERLLADLRRAQSCVETGSILSWSGEIKALFDAAIFLWITPEVRLERLRTRELRRLGRIDDTFMEWAATYDRPGNRETRSQVLHEEWLAGLDCPVLNLEGDLSKEDRLARSLEWLRSPPQKRSPPTS